MQNNLSATEPDDGIAALRDNIRRLIEQAVTQSGTGDDDRTSEWIATQSAELEKLIEQREILRRTEGRAVFDDHSVSVRDGHIAIPRDSILVLTEESTGGGTESLTDRAATHRTRPFCWRSAALRR
jgi:hypothetical protein